MFAVVDGGAGGEPGVAVGCLEGLEEELDGAAGGGFFGEGESEDGGQRSEIGDRRTDSWLLRSDFWFRGGCSAVS